LQGVTFLVVFGTAYDILQLFDWLNSPLFEVFIKPVNMA